MEQTTNENILEKRKRIVKEKLLELKNPDLSILNDLEKLDNTNPDLIKEKLNIQRSYKTLLNAFDILSKEDLSKFGIIKKCSNRESFFYFLNYIINVIILKDEGISNKYKIEEESEIKTPKILIDLSNEKISIKNLEDDTENSESEDDEKSEKKYEKILKRKSKGINEYFILNEKITFDNLRNKIIEYLNIISNPLIYRNNIPEFDSELFYHYRLKNILNTFIELKDKEKFKDKKRMIYFLTDVIKLLEENEIKDDIVLNYLHFVLDLEYKLDMYLLSLLDDYEEKEKVFKDALIDINENKLIIKDSDIVINNFDCYDLDDNRIQKIKDEIIELPLKKEFYSLKGLITLRELNSKEGNSFYNAFLPSKLLKDIMNILYGEEINIFSTQDVIKLFKDNTYYFSIYNNYYKAYSDKENFKIYIDYKVSRESLQKLGIRVKYITKKSFLVVNTQHEFGHSNNALLCFLGIRKSNKFNTPLVKIKLFNNKEIELEEGGKVIEYLLYGRIISELNLKEIVFICDYKNFEKNLDEFRKDFMNLEHEKLNDVFLKHSKDNKDISEAYNEYINLTEKAKNELENFKIKCGKKYEEEINDFEIESMNISSGKRDKSHNKHKKKYKISKFNLD